MTDVAIALSIAMLLLLWLAIAARAFIAAMLVLRPKFRPPWFAVLIRRAPSWRLFGQKGAIFDLYEVIGDRLDDHDEEHFHSSYGNTRRWFHPFINPYSRYRYLHRELMQSTMYRYMRQRSSDPATTAAVSLLERATRDEVRRQHSGDTRARIAHLYIVVDRGFYAKDAPEAQVSLGPFTV
ncbi:MAG TPA: hypothetical protein VNJ54_10540 [Plantibacter sp.]|uniref:hypothetical protein n=1 Tax=unclassified Plantibacter TaxID=2624265 RepID=UPI002BF537D8|nr:hypothetical protein [Plantibacter sp.]